MQLSFPPLTSATTSIFRTQIKKQTEKEFQPELFAYFHISRFFAEFGAFQRQEVAVGQEIDCTFHPIHSPPIHPFASGERIRSSSLRKRGPWRLVFQGGGGK
jgi:hypothetical protein